MVICHIVNNFWHGICLLCNITLHLNKINTNLNQSAMTTQVEHNLIMVTHQFGKPVYIAPCNKGEMQITDKKQNAERWSKFDRTKIEYQKALTGYELVFETI
jgi:hypothetical protein